MEDVEDSQVTGTKCKEVTLENKERQWPSKKNKRKQPARYCGDARVKIESVNLYERYMSARQDCLFGEPVNYNQDSIKSGG